MEQADLYPLKFEPIYQYRIWGGRRLSGLLNKPLPENDPIGEAWILSDRDDHPSKVTNGKLEGQTISQLMEHSAEQLLGTMAGKFKRFPLLLKFLDCQQVLSVQVHPSDGLIQYIPEGESGKTEAWVVLETGPEAVIYAGLKPGTTEDDLKLKLAEHKIAEDLASFKPKAGDSVLIEAGTVHTLGDVVVFEVQENSDVTYRLYDWDRIEEKTGKPRELQVEEALACLDFSKTEIKPTPAVKIDDGKAQYEQLIVDKHFKVWRHKGTEPFKVGRDALPRILVGIEGAGEVDYKDDSYQFKKGDVMLLPACIGACPFIPMGNVIVLEIALPD